MPPRRYVFFYVTLDAMTFMVTDDVEIHAASGTDVCGLLSSLAAKGPRATPWHRAHPLTVMCLEISQIESRNIFCAGALW